MKTRDKRPIAPDKTHFAVVIPLFNKETTIERAIRSVLDQTVQAFEIIVVNDGSTDNSSKVVESINDPRIRLVHQKNQGVSAARNRGIAEARLDLIAFLDADDEWLPGFLETIQRLVANYPHCAVYATRYMFGMPDGRTRPCIIRGLPDGFSGILEDYFKIAARSDPPIHSSAVVIKKTAINAVGGFPVGVKSGEDLLTWARLAASFTIAYSCDPLTIFNIRTSLFMPMHKPDEDDMIGLSLKGLLGKKKASTSLKQYIGVWYKMRAVQYLQVSKNIEARYELKKMSLFIKPNGNAYIYILISYLPTFFSKKIYSSFCFLKAVRRKLMFTSKVKNYSKTKKKIF